MLALRLAARGGLAERPGAAFEQAFAVVRRIGNDTARDEDLVDLAAVLEPAGRLDEVYEAASTMHDEPRRCELLSRLAVRLHSTEPARSRELLGEAAQVACKAFGDYSRSDALAQVAIGWAGCGEVDVALRLASTIGRGNSRFAALSGIARHGIRTDDSRGRALLDEGIATAGLTIDDELRGCRSTK